jgi:alkylation response protein AidB-like acyl-CoA dehydrogenase
LLYSDTENALRDSVRRLFADRCPPELVARAYDTEPPAPLDFSDIWRTLARDLGVAGLLVPESLGGAGAGAREVAIVMEEIGRAVAPVPFLSSAILATVALLRAGDSETVAALARGEVTGALVVPLSTAPGDPVAGVSIGADGLTGLVSSVAGAGEADVLVVPVAGGDGLELHTVLRAAPGVEVSPLLALDMTRPLATVRFSGPASSRVGPADCAVAEAVQTGAALLASEQLGVAQWCFDTTLAYAKQRKQFGRAIGSYQAIKHRLADLWFEVGAATAVARYAADTRARGDGCGRRCGHRAGLLRRRRRARRRGERPTTRRNRNDLGVSGAPVPQAGQERPVGPRHRLPSPRPTGPVGRPGGFVIGRDAVEPQLFRAVAEADQGDGVVTAAHGRLAHPGPHRMAAFVPQFNKVLGTRSKQRDPAVVGRRAVEKFIEIHRDELVGRIAHHVAERAIREQDGANAVNRDGRSR